MKKNILVLLLLFNLSLANLTLGFSGCPNGNNTLTNSQFSKETWTLDGNDKITDFSIIPSGTGINNLGYDIYFVRLYSNKLFKLTKLGSTYNSSSTSTTFPNSHFGSYGGVTGLAFHPEFGKGTGKDWVFILYRALPSGASATIDANGNSTQNYVKSMVTRLIRYNLNPNTMTLSNQKILLNIVKTGSKGTGTDNYRRALDNTSHFDYFASGQIEFDRFGQLYINIASAFRSGESYIYSHDSFYFSSSAEKSSSNSKARTGSVLRIYPDNSEQGYRITDTLYSPDTNYPYAIYSPNYSTYFSDYYLNKINFPIGIQYNDTNKVHPQVYAKGFRMNWGANTHPVTGWPSITDVGFYAHNDWASVLPSPAFMGFPYINSANGSAVYGNKLHNLWGLSPILSYYDAYTYSGNTPSISSLQKGRFRHNAIADSKRANASNGWLRLDTLAHKWWREHAYDSVYGSAVPSQYTFLKNKSPFNEGVELLPAIPRTLINLKDFYGDSIYSSKFKRTTGHEIDATGDTAEYTKWADHQVGESHFTSLVAFPIYIYDSSSSSTNKLPPHFDNSGLAICWEQKTITFRKLKPVVQDHNGQHYINDSGTSMKNLTYNIINNPNGLFPELESNVSSAQIAPDGTLITITETRKIERIKYTGNCLPSNTAEGGSGLSPQEAFDKLIYTMADSSFSQLNLPKYGLIRAKRTDGTSPIKNNSFNRQVNTSIKILTDKLVVLKNNNYQIKLYNNLGKVLAKSNINKMGSYSFKEIFQNYNIKSSVYYLKVSSPQNKDIVKQIALFDI